MASQSIAIIGAGPSGLLLARYLQQQPSFSSTITIYERDASREARTQGGSLDLHGESGLLAMKEAGLMDEFNKFARPEDDQMRILDGNGKVWFDDRDEEFVGKRGPPPEDGGDSGPEYRPEIDRADLRNILLDSLKPNTIKWGHQFTSAEPSAAGHGSYTLHFSNKPSVAVDILVGADGSSSRVRPLQTSSIPLYSGISFVELIITDIDIRYPSLSALVGKGLAFIVDDGKGMIPQRNSKGTVRLYVSKKCPDNWLDQHPLPTTSPLEAKDALKGWLDGFDQSLLDLIDKADDQPMRSYKIYAMSTDQPSWSQKGNGKVTLIGDAAHVMSPFAGEGVNLALLDACELGKTLVDGGDLREFEKKMLERAKDKGEETQGHLNVLYGPEPAKTMAGIMKSYMGGPPPGH